MWPHREAPSYAGAWSIGGEETYSCRRSTYPDRRAEVEGALLLLCTGTDTKMGLRVRAIGSVGSKIFTIDAGSRYGRLNIRR